MGLVRVGAQLPGPIGDALWGLFMGGGGGGGVGGASNLQGARIRQLRTGWCESRRPRGQQQAVVVVYMSWLELDSCLLEECCLVKGGNERDHGGS